MKKSGDTDAVRFHDVFVEFPLINGGSAEGAGVVLGSQKDPARRSHFLTVDALS